MSTPQQVTKKTSISKKLMLWLVSITMVVIVIVGFINYYIFVNQLNEDLNLDLDVDLQTLEEDLNLHMWNLDVKSINKISDEHPFTRILSFLRVNNNFGETIYEVDNRMEGDDYLIKKKNVFYEGEEVGNIEIAASTKPITVAKRVIIRSTIVIVIAVFFTVFMISLFVARSISKPIRDISDVSQEIAEGNLNKKVEVVSKDEVGQLADSFNMMTSKLKVSRDKLEDYSKNLEKKVKDRTKELDVKNKELDVKNRELERFTKFAVGREKRMIELKKQLKKIGMKSAMEHSIDENVPVNPAIEKDSTKPSQKKIVKPTANKIVKSAKIVPKFKINLEKNHWEVKNE